jgi:hypothetical protein
MLTGGLAVAMWGAAGCALFVVGAGATAGAGAVAYHGNELRAVRDVPVERAWEAANAAMKEMEFTIIPAETRKDVTGGVVKGRNAADQVVQIKLLRQTDRVTEIRVRVGVLTSQENLNAGQMLFDKMSKHF